MRVKNVNASLEPRVVKSHASQCRGSGPWVEILQLDDVPGLRTKVAGAPATIRVGRLSQRGPFAWSTLGHATASEARPTEATTAATVPLEHQTMTARMTFLPQMQR